MQTEELIALITIAAAILQIVLFFKVWAMTNDIRALRNTFVFPASLDRDSEIRKALILGDKERAKEIIIQEFIAKVANGDTSNVEDFKKLKAKLNDKLSKIGAEIPPIIDNLETAKDFYKIYE